MPRQCRKKSETGLYHVMLKGIDDRSIFIDEGDRKKFISQLLQAREKGGFSLLAYCLMDNHVHLLIEEHEELGTTMKRITVGYVLWHNHQHGRSGHLFHNRYLSEAIENDEYLVTVTRYIHQNPVKAGLVKKATDYSWSSYTQYLDAYAGKDTQVNPERIRGYFKSKTDFEAFMNRKHSDKCLDYQSMNRKTDEELRAIIEGKYRIKAGRKLAKEKLNELIKEAYQSERASIRQLARVLGVSKGVVEKALK